MFLFLFLLFQTTIIGDERIAWSHDGVNLDHFELGVNEQPRIVVMNPDRLPNTAPIPDDYATKLPLLTLGQHRLVVFACNSVGNCVGSDVLVVNVQVAPPAKPTNVRIIPLQSSLFIDKVKVASGPFYNPINYTLIIPRQTPPREVQKLITVAVEAQ